MDRHPLKTSLWPAVLLVAVIVLLAGWLIYQFNASFKKAVAKPTPTLYPSPVISSQPLPYPYPYPAFSAPGHPYPYPYPVPPTEPAALTLTPDLLPTFAAPAQIVATIQAKIQDLPHPIGESGLSVSFIDEQHGWAVAVPGPAVYSEARSGRTALFVTQDGGQHWEWLADAAVWNLDFVSQQRGWATGGDGQGLLTTTDGGLTWQEYPLPQEWVSKPGNIRAFDFSSLQRGWLLLNPPEAETEPARLRIIRTTDGGSTWQPVLLPCTEKIGDTAVQWNKVTLRLVGEQDAWLICGEWSDGSNQPENFLVPYGWLHHSQDDGQTWEIVKQISGRDLLFNRMYRSAVTPSLSFADVQTGWIGSGETGLFTTIDGGQAWNETDLPYFDNTNFHDLHTFSPLSGLAVWENSYAGVLAKTRGGGESWQIIFPPTLPRQVQFFDTQSGIGLGSYPWQNNQFFRTSDGGRTWQPAGLVGKPYWHCSKPNSDEHDCVFAVLSFDFVSKQTGWALSMGDTNALYITQDGGESWTLQPSTPERAYTVSFVDEQVGFLVDAWGTLFVTRDGGQSFEPVSRYDRSAHSKVYNFITPQQGAFADGRAFYWTNDGGQTLAGILLGNHIVDIELLPGGATWLLGVEYTARGQGNDISLWFSPEMGGQWARFNFGKNDGRTNPSISFIDAQHGWLRTSDHLYITADGGYTWEMVR